MYDVLIIGCGITGAATAFCLSRYKLKVCILEKENDVAGGATKANSAILHAGYDPEPGTLMARLNVRGVELARDLCARLDVPYRRCGSLVLAFNKTECAALEELLRRGNENGVKGLRLLTAEEAGSIDGGLSADVAAALFAPSAAICSPWEFCLALAETAVRNGAELHLDTAVTGIERGCGGWTVHTSGGSYAARFVVNAAGTSAARIHDMAAPHAYNIIPSRGQYFLLDKSEGARVSHIVFQCPSKNGKGVLVAPTVAGNLIVGPNAEPADGDDAATTSGGLAFVQVTARKSVPSINFHESIRNFAGIRAHSTGGDFILQEAKGAPGFFDLAGICSPGLSAAPAIGEYAVELLAKAGLPLEEKTDFVCRRRRVRFKSLPPEDKARLVAENPAYGRVICRCETVTEGEILDALHSPIPPRSVDGVKRRVGAGMGRCQGGFCGPRVVELLSRELGVSPGRIVQDKAGTWLLAGETKGGEG